MNVLLVLTELLDGKLFERGVVLATSLRGMLVGCPGSLLILKAKVVVGLVGREAIVARRHYVLIHVEA